MSESALYKRQVDIMGKQITVDQLAIFYGKLK